MLKQWLTKLKEGTEHLNYGRDIIVAMANEYIHSTLSAEVKILDLGFGTGIDLNNIKHNITTNKHLLLYGIDNVAANINLAAQQEISAHLCNIELEKLPFEDDYFDIIIANQVIEHTKEIFWIFSEISRVLHKGGIVIIGVPNLASLHNRILLLLGEQPSSIELLGPHVRGITKKSFIRFVTTDNYFTVIDVKGANFYPFQPKLAAILSKVLTTYSVSLFFLCQRTNKPGKFIDVLNTRFYETEYFKGTAIY
jgi:2-polyprenyl-3-methyl-5-hydroxy-6-metoxy-1,4-benzoquinol methylase